MRPSLSATFSFLQKEKVAQKEKGRGRQRAEFYILYIWKRGYHKSAKIAQKKFVFSQKNTCISRKDRVYFCCSRADQGITAACRRVRAGGCPLPSGSFLSGQRFKTNRSGGKNSGQGGILNRTMCGREAAHESRVRKHTAPCTAQLQKEEETITWQTKESASS